MEARSEDMVMKGFPHWYDGSGFWNSLTGIFFPVYTSHRIFSEGFFMAYRLFP